MPRVLHKPSFRATHRTKSVRYLNRGRDRLPVLSEPSSIQSSGLQLRNSFYPLSFTWRRMRSFAWCTLMKLTRITCSLTRALGTKGRLNFLLGKTSHLKRGQLLAQHMSTLGIKEAARLTERLGPYSLASSWHLTHSTSMTRAKKTEARTHFSIFPPQMPTQRLWRYQISL